MVRVIFVVFAGDCCVDPSCVVLAQPQQRRRNRRNVPALPAFFCVGLEG